MSYIFYWWSRNRKYVFLYFISAVMVLNYNRNLRLFSPLDLKKMILGQCSTPMTISYGNLLIGQEATVSGSSFIWTQIKILDVIDSYNI